MLPARLAFILLALCCLGRLSYAAHFDIKIHYRPLQNAFLDDSSGASKTLDSIQSQLITKLKKVLETNEVELAIYDFARVGDSLKLPTLIIHAELSVELSREELLQLLASQTGKHKLLVPYARQVETLRAAAVKLADKLVQRPKVQPDDPVTDCKNGGILLPNSTCSCDSYFGGADCSELICVHQGLNVDSKRCLCSPGWVGKHCETLPLLPASQSSFDFSTRTLVLVLNNIISTTYDIQQALFALSDYFAKATPERQAFYKNFILLTVVQSGESYIQTQFEEATYVDFINQIASVIPLEGDDTQPILTATHTAITNLKTTLPKSTVFVITDHLASDSTPESSSEISQTIESELTKHALYWQHSINVIISERSDEQRAADPGDPYFSLKRISHRSNGELVDLGKAKTNAKQAVSALLQAQYKAETVDVQRDVDFSSPLEFILSTVKPAQLYVSGSGFQLQDSNNAPINPAIDAGTFALFSLANNQHSLKLVAAQGASAKISYRAVVESDKEIFIAYTNNIEADATSNYAVANIPNYVVLNADEELSSSKISGVSATDSNHDVYSSTDLTKRATDSNFPFIAKTSIECPIGPFLTKIKYQNNEEQILIPSFCYDPEHHKNDNHENSCNGHGVWDTAKNWCSCQKYYDGPNCEITLCQNGGTVNDFPGNGEPICFCGLGFGGDFCEQMSCLEEASKPDFSTKSLSVVMQRSYSQAFLNPEIHDAVKEALDSVGKKQENYFDHLILTTFVKAMVGSDSEINIQTFTKGDDLVNALSAANIKYAITTDTDQSSLEALLQTLQVPEVQFEKNRLVLLFVDAPPKSQEMISKIKEIALQQSIAFNIFVTAPFGLDGSGDCMSEDIVNVYRDLSLTTSGLFFNLCKTFTTGAVKNFVGGYLGASYRYQVARKQTSTDCNTNVPVKIGDSTDLRYFLVDADQSTSFTVTLQTSDGTDVELTPGVQLDTAIFFQAAKLEQKEYQLKVSVTSATKCRIIVAQESDFRVGIGFSPNPSQDASNDTIMFGYQMHPVVYLQTQLQSTAKVDMTSDDDSQYNNVAALRDTNCTYEYYFLDAFSCPYNGAPYSLQLAITSDDGVYIERAVNSYCEKLNVQCLNGGTYQDSKCHCDDQHTGDYCEKLVCINGEASEDRCKCPKGFSGDRCENLECTNWDFLGTHDDNTFEFATIIFAVQNDQNIQSTTKQLKDSIKQYVDTVTTNKKQLKHYSLITFNDKIIENVINTVDTDLFVSTFIDKLNNPINSDKKSTKVRALQSMKLATEINVYRPAIVYVFMNADTVFENQNAILEALTLGGVQINIFYTNEKGLFGGSTSYLKEAVTSSNGRYVWMKPDNVKPLMTDYLPSTVFENALILDESGLDCSQQNEFTFPVESRANSLSVIARGLGISGKISMVDENGTPLPMNVKSSDQASFIATFTTTAGTKKVTYKTTSKECGVQVRAVSGLHTELGFTRDIHDDHPNERPTIVSAKNGSTYVTVKIGKAFMAKADVVPTHIKFLYRDLRTGRNTVLAESDLIARDLNRCANQYISALLEIPPGQYKNNHTPLFAQLTGKEGDTDSFQRLQLYFPETINCQHGVDHDQFGYCNCPATWSGDDCSVPNCKNDGVVDLTVCSCKSGFYGAICDIPVV